MFFIRFTLAIAGLALVAVLVALVALVREGIEGSSRRIQSASQFKRKGVRRRRRRGSKEDWVHGGAGLHQPIRLIHQICPGRSSDRIHPVPGADLLEQTWSHQRRLLLLLLQLFRPQQHQLPPIVISLPLGCHVVPLQVPVREDGGPSRSVEGSMVDCSWGNTGPCLRGLSTTQHTV